MQEKQTMSKIGLSSPITAKKYKNYHNELSRYLASKNLEKLAIVEANKRAFVKNYHFYQLEKRPHKGAYNTAVRYIEYVNLVIDRAIEDDALELNITRQYKLERKQSDKEITALTLKELVQIIEYDQNVNDKLFQDARCIFVFQCQTGLRYCDTQKLSKEYIIRNNSGYLLLNYRSKKEVSRSNVIVPITPIAKIILERYNYELPKMCIKTYNEHIKEIIKKVGIKKHITSHVGRNSFAMINLNEHDVSLESVSKMLGHTSVKTTENHYARPNAEKVMREMKPFLTR